ncbi:cellular tumor antigen p53-like isoform X3 [Macrobrachium nipponense]|uniref:cellular tumor antigen p53-like isoform X3 n=1 Tax=Macrobrachium nipponense TaxID=159736 RepID=UPI0030C89759
MSSDVNYILELTGSEWENLLNDRALDFQVRNYEGDGAQNGCQVSNEVGAPQNETSLPVQSTYGNLYDEFGILNVSPYPPADIFDGQDQESTPQQQQSFNEQPMSTQPPVVVPSEDESGQITVSDPLGQMVQHSSAGIPVTGSQQSNTFQGPRAVSEISVPLYAVPQSTAVVIPQQQQTFTAAKTGGVVDVPALTDMEGDYGFSVTIEEKERTTKSPMWLMSSVTNKLYTNINKAVPFEIQLRKKVPSDKSFYIRAVAVFSSAQFLRTNVTRCPNHASTADMTNHVKVNGMVVSTGFPYPTHVVRADHPEAKYEESLTGRLSVVVPLDKLVDGSDFTPILLRFMCLGSCVGGINRRPIAIILTLENGLGQVFGRKVIDVRVCACPTRDIRTDELALSNKGGKRRGSSHQEKTLPPPRKKPKVEPKVEPQDDDNKLFTIVVRGRKLYDFLTLVKESYLKTHPECADRYHDPSFQNEDSSEDEVKNSNSSQGLEAGDSDSVSWDSGCNFTQQVGVGSVMILR